MQVATPEAYAADPDLVHRFSDERRAGLAGVGPNPAHVALARLGRCSAATCCVVTQNVDDLHEARVRSTSFRCTAVSARPGTACDARAPVDGVARDRPACLACGRHPSAPRRPWFGEVPHGMDAHRAGALGRRPLRVDRHVRTGLPRRRVRAVRRRARHAHAGAQPRRPATPTATSTSRAADRPPPWSPPGWTS